MSEQVGGGPFRFCPRCAGALERQLIKAGDQPRLVCRACDSCSTSIPVGRGGHHHSCER